MVKRAAKGINLVVQSRWSTCIKMFHKFHTQPRFESASCLAAKKILVDDVSVVNHVSESDWENCSIPEIYNYQLYLLFFFSFYDVVFSHEEHWHLIPFQLNWLPISLLVIISFRLNKYALPLVSWDCRRVCYRAVAKNIT